MQKNCEVLYNLNNPLLSDLKSCLMEFSVFYAIGLEKIKEEEVIKTCAKMASLLNIADLNVSEMRKADQLLNGYFKANKICKSQVVDWMRENGYYGKDIRDKFNSLVAKHSTDYLKSHYNY